MAFVFKKISPVRRKVRIAKSERSEKILADLSAYIESGYEEPMKWLLRIWKEQAGSFKYSDLYSIATDEPLPGPVFDGWFKSYSDWLAGKMTDTWKEAMLAGWRNNPALEEIKEFTFNSSEARVRSWIQNHGAELVTNCIQEQKRALQYIIAEGQAKGISSAELGRYIRPTIGLTRPQAAANLRHYETLKEQLRKDHPRMSQESIEQKARASAARYAAKQQRYRAETIARTEIATAYNKGYDESVRQAMNQRLLPIMKKVWSAANADHVCPVCEDLDGTTLDMDQEFQTTRGVRVIRNVSCPEPPIHPRCRCTLIYEETGEYVTVPVSYEGLEDDWADLGEDAQIIDVNPDDFSDNCVNCTIAYEMRCRGKSVVAGSGIEALNDDAFAGWINPEVIPVVPGENAFEYIDSAIGLWGNGARVQIAILRYPKFEGSRIPGHSFVAQQRGISTSYIDVQNGVSYNIDELKKMFQNAYRIDICRIDELDLSEIGFAACREVR